MSIIKVNHKLRGEFDVICRRHNSDGTHVDRVALRGGRNLITNHGMDVLGTAPIDTFMSDLRVGTGATAPANSDTALTSQVARVGRTGGATRSWQGLDLVVSALFQFAAGAATGNIAELGMASSTTGNINTHALFLDENGDPITITVLADEQLIVTYRVIISVNTSDSVLTVNTGPTPTDFTLTLRPALLGNTHGSANVAPFATVIEMESSQSHLMFYGANTSLGSVESQPTQGSGGGQQSLAMWITATSGSISRAAYVNGSHQREVTWNLGLNNLNFANIGEFLLWGSPFRWQLSVRPRPTKTNLTTMQFKFVSTWARG